MPSAPEYPGVRARPRGDDDARTRPYGHGGRRSVVGNQPPHHVLGELGRTDRELDLDGALQPGRRDLATSRTGVRAAVSGGAKLFASLPQDTVCTEIYGGPQKARVVGTVNGQRVRAMFTRTNGCEISRWQRISPWLLPAGGVS